MGEVLRAVIFDMDGLLIDSEVIYQAAFQRAGAELAAEIDDALYRSVVGVTIDEGERLLVAAKGADFPLADFRELWPRLFLLEIETHGMPLKPGALALIEALESGAIPFALATSSDRHFTERSLDAAGLADRFEVVVTCDAVERGKPSPDLFLEAARRLGRRPAECLVLEDSDAGARAAIAAKMKVIVVPDLAQPDPEIRRLAHSTLGDLVEARPVVLDLLASAV